MNVFVGDVMITHVITVNIEDNIEKAASIMKKGKIGSVVVMDGKDVRGMLSTSDIVYKYVAEGMHTAKVSEIMTRDLITITPERTIEEAARLMAQNKIERLPVFNNKKLIGIITSGDILKIEPALFEILLEKAKISNVVKNDNDVDIGECELCGNFTDDVEEHDGVYMCSECQKR